MARVPVAVHRRKNQFMDVVRTALTLRPAGTLKKEGGAGRAPAAGAPVVDVEPVESPEERGEE